MWDDGDSSSWGEGAELVLLSSSFSSSNSSSSSASLFKDAVLKDPDDQAHRAQQRCFHFLYTSALVAARMCGCAAEGVVLEACEGPLVGDGTWSWMSVVGGDCTSRCTGTCRIKLPCSAPVTIPSRKLALEVRSRRGDPSLSRSRICSGRPAHRQPNTDASGRLRGDPRRPCCVSQIARCSRKACPHRSSVK
jgi:hypothetical protein